MIIVSGSVPPESFSKLFVKEDAEFTYNNIKLSILGIDGKLLRDTDFYSKEQILEAQSRVQKVLNEFGQQKFTVQLEFKVITRGGRETTYVLSSGLRVDEDSHPSSEFGRIESTCNKEDFELIDELKAVVFTEDVKFCLYKNLTLIITPENVVYEVKKTVPDRWSISVQKWKCGVDAYGKIGQVNIMNAACHLICNIVEV